MKKMLALIAAVSLTASTSILSVSCSKNNNQNNSDNNGDNSNPIDYPTFIDWKVVIDKDEFSNNKINNSFYFAVWSDWNKASYEITSFRNIEPLKPNEKQIIKSDGNNTNLVLAMLGINERSLYTWNQSSDLFNEFNTENSDIKYVYKYVGNDPNNLILPQIDTNSGSFL